MTVEYRLNIILILHKIYMHRISKLFISNKNLS